MRAKSTSSRWALTLPLPWEVTKPALEDSWLKWLIDWSIWRCHRRLRGSTWNYMKWGSLTGPTLPHISSLQPASSTKAILTQWITWPVALKSSNCCWLMSSSCTRSNWRSWRRRTSPLTWSTQPSFAVARRTTLSIVGRRSRRPWPSTMRSASRRLRPSQMNTIRSRCSCWWKRSPNLPKKQGDNEWGIILGRHD